MMAFQVFLAILLIPAVLQAQATPEFVIEWGQEGSAPGEFVDPYGVTLTPDGHLLVADGGNGRIQEFLSDGTFVRQIGGFAFPIGVATDPSGNIYATDFDLHRVSKFDDQGNLLSHWGRNGGDGSSGNGPGEFTRPAGIAIASNGNVYVVEDIHRVQVFSSSGEYLFQFGGVGSGPGQLRRPRGIAIDRDDNVYVGGLVNERVQKFDAMGNYIAEWGVAGSGDGEFNNPYEIFIDHTNRVFVADGGNDRIQVFTNTGAFLLKWGSSGLEPGKFLLPWGVVVDDSGFIYVSDHSDRIEKFRMAPVSVEGRSWSEVKSNYRE